MAYPEKPRTKLQAGTAATAERLQALIGERRANTPEQQAVLREAPGGLGTLALKSAYAAGAAPTAAEHNALVEDMRALGAVLNAMGAKITWS